MSTAKEKNDIILSSEIINRYVSGQASLSEIAQVTKAMSEDESIRDLVGIMEKLSDNGSLSPDAEIPMASMAALAEGNLCDVMCEQYILKEYLGEKAFDSCVNTMLDNCWLKESGTPLHNIGRLLEQHGMVISHKYDCTMEEVEDLLAKRCKIIAVVDYGQLWENESNGIFHAVVCLSVTDGVIRIYDPAIDGFSNYLEEDFDKAWAYSKHYITYATTDNIEYMPHPIDVSEIELDDSLMELSEAIAENAHEVWSSNRYAEGWRFGPERNDKLKQHPDMVPYSELTEGEKNYDRVMAFNTLRLVKKLGFNITRKYTKYCPHCGEYVDDSFSFCPNCGESLENCE